MSKGARILLVTGGLAFIVLMGGLLAVSAHIQDSETTAKQQRTAAARARNALAVDVGALRAQVKRLGGTPVAPPAAQTLAQIPGQVGAAGATGPAGASVKGPRGPRGFPGIPGAKGSPGVDG